MMLGVTRQSLILRISPHWRAGLGQSRRTHRIVEAGLVGIPRPDCLYSYVKLIFKGPALTHFKQGKRLQP